MEACLLIQYISLADAHYPFMFQLKVFEEEFVLQHSSSMAPLNGTLSATTYNPQGNRKPSRAKELAVRITESSQVVYDVSIVKVFSLV